MVQDVIKDGDSYYDDPNFDPQQEWLGTSPPYRSPLPLHIIFTENDSPYPEVRSAVANADDPSMPSGTLRAWFLGILMAIIIPGLNQFFWFRYPSVSIGSVSLFYSISSYIRTKDGQTVESLSRNYYPILLVVAWPVLHHRSSCSVFN